MKRFTKTIEDFICEHCATAVQGNGYTDHCPNCLYGKHVDINPGDRQSTCLGTLIPIDAEKNGENWTLVYTCTRCSKRIRNKLSPGDSFDTLVKITSQKRF
jgi:hypothetical protein